MTKLEKIKLYLESSFKIYLDSLVGCTQEDRELCMINESKYAKDILKENGFETSEINTLVLGELIYEYATVKN